MYHEVRELQPANFPRFKQQQQMGEKLSCRCPTPTAQLGVNISVQFERSGLRVGVPGSLLPGFGGGDPLPLLGGSSRLLV